MPPLSLMIFFIFVVLIFFLAKKITNLAYLFFYRLTDNKNFSLELLSFFLLPGTIIHELSHMLLAELLFVQTGEFSFKPEIDENHQVRVGSLKIAQTDPFRRTFIGLAPLVVGLTIVGLVFNFFILKQFNHLTIQQFFNISIEQLLLLLVTSYLLLVTSLTMFSSKKDLEQLLIPAIILFLLGLIFWLAGFRLTIPQSAMNFMDKILTQLNKGLGLVIILNMIVFGLLKGLNFATSAIFRR